MGWTGTGREVVNFAFTPWIDAAQRLEAQWLWPCIPSRALPTSTSGPGPVHYSCWLLDDSTQPFRELNDQLWGCWAITPNFSTLHLLSGETETAPLPRLGVVVGLRAQSFRSVVHCFRGWKPKARLVPTPVIASMKIKTVFWIQSEFTDSTRGVFRWNHLSLCCCQKHSVSSKVPTSL